MARDERRRQKRLRKKKAKRKIARAVSLKAAARDINWVIEIAARSPVHECLVPETLFQVGLGNILLSKKMPGGDIAVGAFLLDVYCLGVKDAFLTVLTPGQYAEQKKRIESSGSLGNMEPACVRKLIEGGVNYARNLGFEPHHDYEKAVKIFGEINSADSPTEFEYGRDGKPLYISGPNDAPWKARMIMNTLEQRCGPDGFEYLMGGPL